MPRTVEALQGIPAIRSLLAALDKEERLHSKGLSPSSLALQRAQATPQGSAERSYFMSRAGFAIVLWLRHIHSHVHFPVTDVPENGLSSQLVGQVAHAAAACIAGLQGGTFELSAELGVLQLREGRGLHRLPRRGSRATNGRAA